MSSKASFPGSSNLRPVAWPVPRRDLVEVQALTGGDDLALPYPDFGRHIFLEHLNSRQVGPNVKISSQNFPLTHYGIWGKLFQNRRSYHAKKYLKNQDEFLEIGTRTVDERNRVTLGELIKGSKRIRIYQNDRGEVLLKPVVEIPASEFWLFQNKTALKSVLQGLKEANLPAARRAWRGTAEHR